MLLQVKNWVSVNKSDLFDGTVIALGIACAWWLGVVSAVVK